MDNRSAHAPWRFIGLVAFLALGMVGCRLMSPEAEEPPLSLTERLARLGYQQGAPLSFIPRYDIRHWQPLDDEHLLLERDKREAFMIEFSQPCRDLNFDSFIAYTTTSNQLTTHDQIRRSGPSGVPQVCRIRELYRLQPLPKNSAS